MRVVEIYIVTVKFAQVRMLVHDAQPLVSIYLGVHAQHAPILIVMNVFHQMGIAPNAKIHTDSKVVYAAYAIRI